MATIYKRGTIYWGRAQRGGREFRKSLGTSSRTVALKRLDMWVEEIEASNWGDLTAKSYHDAMMYFLDNHLPTLEVSSQRRYELSAKHLTRLYKNEKLYQINNAKLAEFENMRRAEGAAPPTIRRDLACLSSMFETVIMDWDMNAVNPVPAFLKKRKKRGLRESPPRTRYLTQEEEDALIAHAASYLQPMIMFAIDTGLRLSEQLSLTWDCVNLARKEILVKKSKNKHQRIVPLLERSAQKSAQLTRHIKTPHYLFHKSDGSRYLRVTRGLAGAARRAGIKDLRWHDLRRTCGCRLLQDYEMSIEQVSKWLGHKTITQTQRAYAFLEVDHLHKAILDRTKTGTGHAD